MSLTYFNETELLNPPLKRAAYSDRTSWLMAEMSRLAYHRFEGDGSLRDLSQALLSGQIGGGANIHQALNRLLGEADEDAALARQFLEDQLQRGRFSLINTYDKGGTQGFLAKFNDSDGGEPFLVLAFRGTEKRVEDIRTDFQSDLVRAPGGGKVHRGFLDAFRRVEVIIDRDLKQHPGLPVYVTGHSLGGALAVVATKYIANDSLGACYTFGGPRVGDLEFASRIKTPIYRIVNADDGVARIPPVVLPFFLVKILQYVPMGSFLRRKIIPFMGYAHYGDMRHLSSAPEKHEQGGEDYPNLILRANPPISVQFYWILKRVLFRGQPSAVVDDHAVSTYCRKLAIYALRRN